MGQAVRRKRSRRVGETGPDAGVGAWLTLVASFPQQLA